MGRSVKMWEVHANKSVETNLLRLIRYYVVLINDADVCFALKICNPDCDQIYIAGMLSKTMESVFRALH